MQEHSPELQYTGLWCSGGWSWISSVWSAMKCPVVSFEMFMGLMWLWAACILKVTQVQETQRVPNRINPRRNTPRHMLIKLTKIKHEQILKAAREKQQITHKGIPIRITADLSIETLQARREWQDILEVMKEKNLQPRLLYPARISFKYEGEIKSFTDKQKLREFSTTKPALQQILKDLL